MHKQRIWSNRNHTILLALHPFIPDNDDHAKMSTKNFGTYHPIALQHISRIIQFSFYFLSRLLFNCINASFLIISNDVTVFIFNKTKKLSLIFDLLRPSHDEGRSISCCSPSTDSFCPSHDGEDDTVWFSRNVSAYKSKLICRTSFSTSDSPLLSSKDNRAIVSTGSPNSSCLSGSVSKNLSICIFRKERHSSGVSILLHPFISFSATAF